MEEIKSTWAYSIVSDFYKNKKANRSGVSYMIHIDEGLVILREINASIDAMKGFCLHPLVQNGKDLKNNYSSLSNCTSSRGQLLLAMEYRNIANQFLSTKEDHPGFNDFSKINLSPLKDVNDMLVADKVQNYKDFIKYHKKTHPRSEYLDSYFKAWLGRLNISKAKFEILVKRINGNYEEGGMKFFENLTLHDKRIEFCSECGIGMPYGNCRTRGCPGAEEPLRYTCVKEKTLAEVRGADIPRGLTADDVAVDGAGGRTFR